MVVVHQQFLKNLNQVCIKHFFGNKEEKMLLQSLVSGRSSVDSINKLNTTTNKFNFFEYSDNSGGNNKQSNIDGDKNGNTNSNK